MHSPDRYRKPLVSGIARQIELDKMTKFTLASMHVKNGGQMGLTRYLQWTKDELVNAVLEDEGIDPWKL